LRPSWRSWAARAKSCRRDHDAERRPQKITFKEMRDAGVRGILV
jgi:hypothetical protein